MAFALTEHPVTKRTQTCERFLQMLFCAYFFATV
jgi:hypothetical protein